MSDERSATSSRLRSPEISTMSSVSGTSVLAVTAACISAVMSPRNWSISSRRRRRLVERQAGEMRVDVVGRLGQLRRRVIARRREHPVLHVALGRDDDQQDALVRQAHELDLLEHVAAARRQHHARELRQVRQHARGGRHDPLLRLAGLQRVLHLPRDGFGVDRCLDRQHRVDEQPVAARRRHAAGRRVRADTRPSPPGPDITLRIVAEPARPRSNGTTCAIRLADRRRYTVRSGFSGGFVREDLAWWKILAQPRDRGSGVGYRCAGRPDPAPTAQPGSFRQRAMV